MKQQKCSIAEETLSWGHENKGRLFISVWTFTLIYFSYQWSFAILKLSTPKKTYKHKKLGMGKTGNYEYLCAVFVTYGEDGWVQSPAMTHSFLIFGFFFCTSKVLASVVFLLSFLHPAFSYFTLFISWLSVMPSWYSQPSVFSLLHVFGFLVWPLVVYNSDCFFVIQVLYFPCTILFLASLWFACRY